MSAIIGILLGLFLFEPAAYRLKAKGYRPAPILWPAILACSAGLMIAAWNSVGYVPALLAAASPLVLALLLRQRPGAPGPSYLRITTTCPHCAKPVAFPRRKEGFPSLCPECQEIVGVPSDQPVPRHPPAGHRGTGLDPVVYRSLVFDDVDWARCRIEAAGIESYVGNGIVGRIDPPVAWADGGLRLYVAPDRVDEAVEILEEPPGTAPIPADAHEPPLVESASPEGRTAEFLVRWVLALAVVPYVLALLATWLAPLYYAPQPLPRNLDVATFQRPITFAVGALAALSYWRHCREAARDN